jgi:hypothetical protein
MLVGTVWTAVYVSLQCQHTAYYTWHAQHMHNGYGQLVTLPQPLFLTHAQKQRCHTGQAITGNGMSRKTSLTIRLHDCSLVFPASSYSTNNIVQLHML